MGNYLYILEKRAIIEDIDLFNTDDENKSEAADA